MTSRLWSVAFFVPFLGLVAASCSTDTHTTRGPDDPSCVPTSKDDEIGWTINARTLSSEGRELTYEKRFIAAGDESDNVEIETAIRADGELVMSILESGNSERWEVNVDFGSLVQGVRSTTAVVEGGVVSGSVDDRLLVAVALEQADPSASTFQDGGPAPEIRMDADVEAGLPALLEAGSAAAEKCAGPSGGTEASLAARNKRGDRGHVSLATYTDDCIECRATCFALELACGVVAGVGCIAANFFVAVCVAVEEAKCALATIVCILACNADGAPCCPVGCGSGCCLKAETCLSHQSRLCCGTDQYECMGNECCNNSEVCIDSGAKDFGTCCDPGNRCVDACCQPEDTCLPAVSECCTPEQTPCVDKCCEEAGCIEGINSGTCCEPLNICGNVCCSDLDSCIHFQDGTGLCCGFATPACGDKCCGAAEACLGGGNCCPSERVCAGTCCSEGSGCDLQTNQCKSCGNANEKYCSASDSCCPITQVCTPVSGLCCQANEMYCGVPARCRPFEECLR